MLKEKVYVLSNYIKQGDSLSTQLGNRFKHVNYFNDYTLFINNIVNGQENNSLFILFVEYPFLHEVSKQLANYDASIQYILNSYLYENIPIPVLPENVYDFIYCNDDKNNYNLFFNRLNNEIQHRNKLAFLQYEVNELKVIGRALSSEKDTIKLFEMIINSSMRLTSSDAGTMYLVVDKNTGKWSSIDDNDNYENYLLKFVIAKNISKDLGLEEFTTPISKDSISGYTIITGESFRIDDAYNISENLDYNHNKTYDIDFGYKTKSILTIPMKDHNNNTLGVIQLINKKMNKQDIIDYTNPESLEGIINYDSTDEIVMNALASQAAIALENNLLYEGMQELLENYKLQNEQLLFLSRKILKAHEEERKRIAREIHDGPAQSVANLSLKLEICKKFFQLNDTAKGMKEMDDLRKDVISTVKEVRTIIYDLKPSYLEGGLTLAIKNRLQKFKENSDINVKFYSSGDDSNIEYYLTSTIYRIIQEALTNIKKHAKANNVRVVFKINKDEIYLSISDDGKGFNITDISNKSKLESGFGLYDGGFGLDGIKERIEIVNGDIKIKSAPNKGTDIIINIPLQ